jgi:AcrR family transcriptional regulator
MIPPRGRREQRKTETRQTISDVATELIIRRGFEAVSMSEIAECGGVSRKTVFNYFASKEDLVFDRDEEARTLLREGMAARRGMARWPPSNRWCGSCWTAAIRCCGSMPVQRPSGQPWPTARCWWRTRDGCRRSWPTTWRS